MYRPEVTKSQLQLMIDLVFNNQQFADNEEEKREYQALLDQLKIEQEFGKDYILDSWCIDDVKSLDETLTDQECREVLQAVFDNRDATIGINWDVIQYHIDQLER